MGNLISEETLHKLEADTSFQQLSQKMQTLNIFEVLGITNAEIRHSNFLAWLLDPNGNHGMGDKFLREFVSKLGQREVVPENVTVCIVRREWQHIDLLVLCQKEKYFFYAFNTDSRNWAQKGAGNLKGFSYQIKAKRGNRRAAGKSSWCVNRKSE